MTDIEDSRKDDHDGKRKRSSGSGSDDEDKKKRVKWAGHLHDQFLRAVQKLGEKAVPSAILNEMGVEGLTRENVASHLQKYRVQTREKLLSEYLKSNSSGGFGALDDMRGPPSDAYSQPPPEAYLRRRSESELSYYHSHNYSRNPVHPYPPYHLPPSAVHSSSNHSAPPPPPPHSSAPSEPPSRSGPYDHPPYPPPNYHGPPHPNNYSYPNYGYGHSGNGRSASFSYNPRDYHGGPPPPAAAGGYSSIEPFADFDSPPSWRTGQQLVVSPSQPPPLPPTQQRSGSFSEPALPRRPSYNEAMLQQQVNQPPPPPQTFAEPPARRPSFSGEGRRGSFSTEGRRGSFTMAQQPPPQQQPQQPPQHSQPPQQQHSQPPPQQHPPPSHSGLSSLPPLPPPPSIRTSYDSVPTSVLTGGSSNYFDVNTPTSSEYSSDVLLSLSENHSSQMTPTTISFPPPSPSPEPSSLSAQSKDPFSDFPHIGNGGQTSSSYNDSYSSPYPAHAHAAPNAGYSNYHHACGNNWCTGCNKVEEQV